MACQQLVEHVEAAAQFLAALGPAHRAQALGVQIDAVKAMIHRISGPAEALRANGIIVAQWGSFLTAVQRAELEMMVNVQAGAVTLPSNRTMQDWSMDFWRVLPVDLYKQLQDTSISASSRMFKLFEYLAGRGLRLPAEKVYGAMLALHFYAEGIPGLMNGSQMLASINSMKEQWRAFIAEYKKNLMGIDKATWTWPGPPPHLGAAALTSLEQAKFHSIMSCIPLRTSSLKVSDSASQRSRRPQKPMLQIHTRTDLGGRGRSMFALETDSPGLGAAPRALMDTPQTAGLSCAGAGAAEGVPSAALVVQAAGQTVDGKAEPAAAGQELAQKGGRKSLAEVTAELMASKTENKKTKQVSKSKNKQASSKNESEQKEPQKKKAMQKKKKKKGFRKMVLKPPTAASSLPSGAQTKRPAAKEQPMREINKGENTRALFKKGEAPGEDIRRRMRCGSPNTRKALFWKYGCAKCKWKARCTASCWKQRKMEVPSAAEIGEDVE